MKNNHYQYGHRGAVPKPAPTKLYYKPHQSQQHVHNSRARYRVVVCGRRFGKSLLAAAEAIKYLLSKQAGMLKIGWIAPTYQVCTRGFEAFTAITRDVNIFQIKSSMPAVIKFNNNKLYFLSADHPESIRGFGFDYLIIDEADFIKDEVWEQILKATCLDMKAPVLFISTPKRKNSYLHNLYLDGLKKLNDCESFHFPSADNPYLPMGELEKYKLTLPEDVFRQEFLAEWIDAGGSVFPSLDDINVHKVCSCKGGAAIMGVDLGQMHDFTVVTNLCPSCKVVRYIEKFNKIDYGAQKEIITKLYNDDIKAGKQPEIIIDVTGVGRPIYDDLKINCNCTPFAFSNNSKNQLISRLRVAISEKEISISSNLKNYDVLRREMEGFIVTKTPSGLVSYSNGVDSGYDDTVISLGLATWGIGEYCFPTVLSDSDYGGLWEPEVDF